MKMSEQLRLYFYLFVREDDLDVVELNLFIS